MSEERALHGAQQEPLVTEPQYGSPYSPFLTAEEAWQYLRFASRRSFYRAIQSQNIPHRRRGNSRTLLFLRSELNRWLEQGAGERRPRPTLVSGKRARG